MPSTDSLIVLWSAAYRSFYPGGRPGIAHSRWTWTSLIPSRAVPVLLDGVRPAAPRAAFVRLCEWMPASVRWTELAIVDAVQDWVVRYGEVPARIDWDRHMCHRRGH